MAKSKEDRLPTERELDAMVGTTPFDGECQVLCAELLDAVEELQGATGITKVRIQATIRAFRARLKELHCTCFPQ